jgi:hypothetical protein
VEEASNSATFRSQPVVRCKRGIRLLPDHRYTTCLKQRQRLWRNPEPAVATAAEDYQIRLVVQQLSNVCAKDSRPVVGARFAPVPRSSTTGPEFDVAEPAERLYLDEAPTVVDDPGRRVVHIRRLAGHVAP